MIPNVNQKYKLLYKITFFVVFSSKYKCKDGITGKLPMTSNAHYITNWDYKYDLYEKFQWNVMNSHINSVQWKERLPKWILWKTRVKMESLLDARKYKY